VNPMRQVGSRAWRGHRGNRRRGGRAWRGHRDNRRLRLGEDFPCCGIVPCGFHRHRSNNCGLRLGEDFNCG
jgi:hypothetical protein